MSGRTARRLPVDATVLHTPLALLVGLVWWQWAPSVQYVVVNGAPFLRGEANYLDVFAADGTFALLGAAAGLACAAGLLVRGHRGVAVAVAVAVGGLLGSVLAWQLGVLLGPGSLADLSAAISNGDVVVGPELGGYVPLLIWPIVALAVVLVTVALSAPEHTVARSSPGSAG